MRASSFFLFALAGSALAQAPAAPPVPDTVLADRDIEYSAVGGRQTMDIVRPKGASATPRPTVLLVHGGGFRAGNKEGYIGLAVKLAERGYVAATANYRLSPGNQFPAAGAGCESRRTFSPR